MCSHPPLTPVCMLPPLTIPPLCITPYNDISCMTDMGAEYKTVHDHVKRPRHIEEDEADITGNPRLCLPGLTYSPSSIMSACLSAQPRTYSASTKPTSHRLRKSRHTCVVGLQSGRSILWFIGQWSLASLYFLPSSSIWLTVQRELSQMLIWT
jgi:hypothetical protein